MTRDEAQAILEMIIKVRSTTRAVGYATHFSGPRSLSEAQAADHAAYEALVLAVWATVDDPLEGDGLIYGLELVLPSLDAVEPVV